MMPIVSERDLVTLLSQLCHLLLGLQKTTCGKSVIFIWESEISFGC